LGLEMFVSDPCGYNNKYIYALRSWSTLPINIKDPHVKQHPETRALQVVTSEVKWERSETAL